MTSTSNSLAKKKLPIPQTNGRQEIQSVAHAAQKQCQEFPQ